MDVIEKAIRGAFEKGDADSRAFRERVYRSAFAALDRALQANPGVTVETAISRRKALQAKITEIEQEYIPVIGGFGRPRTPAPEPAPETKPEPQAAPPPPEIVPAAPEPPTVAAPAAAAAAPEPPSPEAARVTPAPPPVSEPPPPAASAAEPETAPPPRIALPAEPPPPPPAAPEPAAPVEPPEAAAQPPLAEAEPVLASPVAVPDGTPSPSEASVVAFPAIDVAPQRAVEGEKPFQVEPDHAPGPPADAGTAPEIVLPADPAGRTASPEVVVVEPVGVPAGTPPRVSEPETVPVDPDAAVLRERRRPYAAMFLAVTLLSLGAIGLWWAAETGLLKTAAERDTTVPNPPRELDSEDFIPEDEEPVQEPVKPGEVDALKDWITVFAPSDPSGVNAPAGTSAEVVEGEEGPVMRLRSGASDSAILFDVGQGVLEQIAGRSAVFDIVARAEEGKETQISVTCNFGELGGCGRKRYAVGHERGEFLFEMTLPDARPGAGGTIAIDTDVSNQGKAIDLFEIRVSTTD